MKTLRKIFIAILAFASLLNLNAQMEESSLGDSSYEAVINLVMENNKTLQAARDLMEVSILEARTGITPPDPEVEIGYMFGRPDGTGNRLDFSVSQHFDFPSSYIHMSRLKEEKTMHAELSYDITRQDVVLEARQHWIMGVSLNIRRTLLARRLENAETLVDHFKQKLDAGEVGALSFSQANLQLIGLQTDFEEVELGIMQNQLTLNLLCGGTLPDISIDELPVPALLLSDSILRVYENSPEMLYYLRQREIKERQKSLVISQNLPKLSAGYYSETVINQQFKGVQVGMSIPLWENKNKIKMARSAIIFAEADADRFAGIQEKDLLQKLEWCTSLDKQITSMEEALSMVNDDELLSYALESGEISLAEYIYSSELYFNNLLLLQELKRDRLLVEAELLKVYY